MNKAICLKTDVHFTSGTEYECTDAYAIYEDVMVDILDDYGELIHVSINDSDFDFMFDHSGKMNKMIASKE
jgi:hypothetical protein